MLSSPRVQDFQSAFHVVTVVPTGLAAEAAGLGLDAGGHVEAGWPGDAAPWKSTGAPPPEGPMRARRIDERRQQLHHRHQDQVRNYMIGR